jgi:hypothetical protein
MSILSMGTSITDEVEAALNRTTPVDPLTQEGALISRIVLAAEAFVKRETGRRFERSVIEGEYYDVAPGTTDLLLSDRPVVSIESIGHVESRGDDGTVTSRSLGLDEYVVNIESGIVSSLVGAFLPGRQSVVLDWTVGYTPEEIAANADDDIRILKQLCLSIIQNWYNKNKIGTQASSISFGDENATLTFGLTDDEKRLLNLLRL